MEFTSGTKERILFVAIHLFANKGYDGVSIKEIAAAAGIKQASIYNHYTSKVDILDQVYTFYKERIYLAKPSMKEAEAILKSGTVQEIMQIFNYPLPEPSAEMFAIVRIIWGRIYIDEAAREIYNEYVVNDGLTYVNAVLFRLRELGRTTVCDKQIEVFAHLAVAARTYAANATVADPDQKKWRVKETDMLDAISGMLQLQG